MTQTPADKLDKLLKVLTIACVTTASVLAGVLLARVVRYVELQAAPMQILQWRGEPRYIVKGPYGIVGGEVHVLQDNGTDSCYPIVTFRGMTFGLDPQPCAE